MPLPLLALVEAADVPPAAVVAVEDMAEEAALEVEALEEVEASEDLEALEEALEVTMVEAVQGDSVVEEETTAETAVEVVNAVEAVEVEAVVAAAAADSAVRGAVPHPLAAQDTGDAALHSLNQRRARDSHRRRMCQWKRKSAAGRCVRPREEYLSAQALGVGPPRSAALDQALLNQDLVLLADHGAGQEADQGVARHQGVDRGVDQAVDPPVVQNSS